MARKRLPIPLILLIPICLLLLVIVAGVYRFSLSDEEILQKFPDRQKFTDRIVNAADPVVQQVLGMDVPNPWTIKVPESNAFFLLTDVDKEQQVAFGNYDDGLTRGKVQVHYAYLQPLKGRKAETLFVAPFSVSNQGSGVFYYLGIFKWDQTRQRIVLSEQHWIGDRIVLGELTLSNNIITLAYTAHGANQSFAQQPNEAKTLSCDWVAEQGLTC